ncbi:unnamed protein product [Thelazia callipaeda]|uniref:WW domain-containing protein n=1 Tax=Thelazia callipaeda TaxID=103827 RepID=A0A0N5D7X4_THECL|nr:unnamed protein product [Thelazia callipaeda]
MNCCDLLNFVASASSSPQGVTSGSTMTASETANLQDVVLKNRRNGGITMPSGNSINMEDDNKQKRFRQQNNKKSGCVRPLNTSNTSQNNDNLVSNDKAPSSPEQKQQETVILDEKMMKTVCDFKEAYWYYDPKTDGFYYDSKGSRGWRRRNPACLRKLMLDKVISFWPSNDGVKYLSTDANVVPHVGADTCSYLYNNNSYFSHHIQYYDPETDGFYFEMPSIDGWKKRQPQTVASTTMSSAVPTPASTTSLSHSSNSGTKMTDTNTLSTLSSVAKEADTVRTSYGAVLARGQLPPCTITASTTVTSGASAHAAPGETFSQAESFSNRSSNDSFCPQSSLMFDKAVAAGWDKETKNKQISLSYVDIVASPVDTAGSNTATNDDIENNPPTHLITSTDYKRPETLELHTFAEVNDAVNDVKNKQDVRRSELTNFNADKFIADLPVISTERILRDLAALKTPCSVTSMYSIDSPLSPSFVKGINSPLAKTSADYDSYNDAIYDVEWMLSQILSRADERDWAPEKAASGKSKLNFWRNSDDLVAGVPRVSCDNI